MSVINSGAYLRTSRDFPEDNQALRVEISRAYIDTANSVNNRTIGVFPIGRPAINGEDWFLPQRKFQGQRQVYQITGAGNYPHGINTSQINGFTRIYGTFINNTGNWYPLPYVDATSATNQISLAVTSTNIAIVAGGGSPPPIVSGFVVLEWLA